LRRSGAAAAKWLKKRHPPRRRGRDETAGVKSFEMAHYGKADYWELRYSKDPDPFDCALRAPTSARKGAWPP
jgi:hypothetical protein